MNGGRVGIANGIEGFTAIMAISRVDTFLFFFFLLIFLPILTPDRRIFEYWKLEIWETKKRGGDVINDGRILLCCFEILNCV